MKGIERWFFCVVVISGLLLSGSCGGHGESSPCLPTDPTCGGVSASASRSLNVPFVAQQTQVWCWAATSEMILRYYGVPVSQCQFVSGYTLRNCCAGDPACLVTGPIAVIQNGLFQVGGVRSTFIPRALTFDEVAGEINGGRPIMILYRGSFSGHVVLIVGYNRATGFLQIFDPNYGVIAVPYGATFTYGGQLVWDSTLVGIAR